MSKPLQYLLAVLAVMAMGTSQVLGVARGYVCHCSGEVMALGADCESAGCHDHGDGNDGDHQESPDVPSHDEHQKLTQVLLGHQFAPLVVALPPVSVCAALPGVNCAFLPAAVAWEPDRLVGAPSGCGPPVSSVSVVVARTTVLLV